MKQIIFTLTAILFSAVCFSAELTSEQKAAIVLEPELSDAFYGQTDRIYLNGMWKFKPVINLLEAQPNGVMRFRDGVEMKNPRNDEGLINEFFRPDFNTAGWSEMPVPWPWNIAPGFKKGENVKIPFAGLGYYRRSFNIPAEKKGMRALLRFASVQTECRVWLNGIDLGSHINSSSRGGPPWDMNQRLWLDDFEFDVTSSVIFGGNNTLVLRVFDDGQPLESKKWPDDGGIAGPVTIDFSGATRAAEILVSGNPETGTVRINATLLNAGTSLAGVHLLAELVPFQSEFYSPPVKAKSYKIDLGTVNLPSGKSLHSFSFTVDRPAVWSIDSPFLYRLRLLSDGGVVGQTRFGFRTFEVRDGHFLLNGHPVYLRGTNPSDLWNWNQRILAYNKANWLREGLKLFKEANINLVRVNNGPETEVYYDICDELGILCEEDFAVDSKDMKPEDTRAEMIKTINVDNYVGADGKPIPSKVTIIRKWLGRLHNHPAVCMFSAGNEIGFSKRSGSSEADLAAYMNFFYDFVKANDLQNRPITPSSGLTVWMWSTPLKADFYDYHNYANGYNGWAGSGGENWQWRNYLAKIYGKIDKPVINGECGGYSTGMSFRPDIVVLADNGELNKKKYVKWANDLSVDNKSISYHDFLARAYHTVFNGIRSGLTRDARSMSTAKLNYLSAVAMRRDMDFLEGFVFHDLDPAHFGLETVNPFLTRSIIAGMAEKGRTHNEFIALRDSFAPQAAFLDLCDRHGIAGGKLSSKIFLFNESYAVSEATMEVVISLEDASGKTYEKVTVPFSNIPECSHLSAPFSLIIPEKLATGDYLLRTKLIKTGNVIHETNSPFFVLENTSPQATLITNRNIAVFDRIAKPSENTNFSVAAKVLDELKVPIEKIKNFEKINQFQLLIIGPDAIGDISPKDVPKIRSWLEKGGKLVCLEQSLNGLIPFAPELRYQKSGTMIFADVIDTGHPLFTSLKPWHFEIWNGERVKHDGYWDLKGKAVYTNFIMPMPEGVVLSGGSTGAGWVKNPKFGMVAGEVKIGNGLALFSQVLAVSRYNTDPVATIYLHNLFAYVLSDGWNGQRASLLQEQKTMAGVGKK